MDWRKERALPTTRGHSQHECWRQLGSFQARHVGMEVFKHMAETINLPMYVVFSCACKRMQKVRFLSISWKEVLDLKWCHFGMLPLHKDPSGRLIQLVVMQGWSHNVLWHLVACIASRFWASKSHNIGKAYPMAPSNPLDIAVSDVSAPCLHGDYYSRVYRSSVYHHTSSSAVASGNQTWQWTKF